MSTLLGWLWTGALIVGVFYVGYVLWMVGTYLIDLITGKYQ